MTEKDTITLPREVVKFVLQHLEWWSDDEPQEKEAITALRTALAAEQPSDWDVEALRRDAEQGRWLREWLDNNGLLVRAIRGESLAGYEHPDIEALRRDAERYRKQKERSYRLQRLLKECVKVMQANAVFRDTKAHKDLKTRIRAELENKT